MERLVAMETTARRDAGMEGVRAVCRDGQILLLENIRSAPGLLFFFFLNQHLV